MKNFILVFFLIIGLSGCGVETDSSAKAKNTSGVDGGTDDNSTDDNSSDTDNNDGTSDSTDVTPI
ncbi:MAG: hypothetical protein U9P38_02685, partial [Campylobacterota bacterium]|nr:hypothetical protein [Campylobacterota bacterium]